MVDLWAHDFHHAVFLTTDFKGRCSAAGDLPYCRKKVLFKSAIYVVLDMWLRFVGVNRSAPLPHFQTLGSHDLSCVTRVAHSESLKAARWS